MKIPLTLFVAASIWGGGIARAETVPNCTDVKKEISFYRKMTWAWQDEQRIPRTRAAQLKFRSCKYAQWVATLWVHRAHHELRRVKKMLDKKEGALRELQSNAVTSDWECIHDKEGAWNSNTGNGYYGGLQMDMDFQSAYGAEFLQRWGTADNWPVYAQIIAAKRAKVVTGYSPWPNTARMCGLL